MREIDEVRDRIQQRKGFESRVHQKKKRTPLFSLLYLITIFSMIAGCLYLGYLINEEKHFIDQDKLIGSIQTKMKELDLSKFTMWLPFEKWFKEDTNQVVSNISYIAYRDDYFFGDSNKAAAIDDGIVIYCSEQDSGKIVMVKQDNGIIATYGALTDVQCAENDRILKGTVLGTFDEAIFLQFYLNGDKISYEEAVSMEN